MSAEPQDDKLLGDVRYRNMGLIGNPFRRYELGDPTGVGLVSHAEACDLVSSLDAESLSERPRPVWVNKGASIAEYYHTVALSEVLRSLARPQTPLLGIYMPLDLFRLGRIRGALSMTADAVSARQFDLTIAAWAAKVLSDPDTLLEEYADLDAAQLAGLVERLQSEPNETVAEYFGASVQERQSQVDSDVRQQAAYAAEGGLERDPAEADDTDEMDTDLSAAAPPDLMVEESASEEETEAPGDQAKAVVDYLIAYARAHVSPVVARALHGYIVGGASGASEQLKITKAPKKTLKALLSFAAHRYRKIVLVYDRFDPWPGIEEDGRAIVIGTMSELRWLLADHGMLVLLVAEGIAPELEEQFHGGRKVEWALPGITEMGAKQPPLEADLVQPWIDAASLGEAAPFTIDGPELAPLVQAADGLLEPFAKMAARAIDDAADRGSSTLDAHAIAAALKEEDRD